MPEMRYVCINSRTWLILALRMDGHRIQIMPDSDFLTFSTSKAWALDADDFMDNPDPPCRAMQMAVSASVTVSMAALTRWDIHAQIRSRQAGFQIDLGGQDRRASSLT
jgi:hypothetical protein